MFGPIRFGQAKDILVVPFEVALFMYVCYYGGSVVAVAVAAAAYDFIDYCFS